jgi:hypothetical protein
VAGGTEEESKKIVEKVVVPVEIGTNHLREGKALPLQPACSVERDAHRGSKP